MKRVLAGIGLIGGVVLVTLLAWQSFASDQQGPNLCTPWSVGVDNLDMQSSRTASMTRRANTGTYGLATYLVNLTDADSSITRFDMDCTISNDDNSTDYILQSCSVTSGACTSSDSTWQIASPGTKNWAWRVDVEGGEDIECVFSVGTGSGAAADLLTVTQRYCTKG